MLRTELYRLIAFALYPLWLIAGGCDYWCHRRTRIESTSGVTEARMHVAQYVCIVLIVALAALFRFRGPALWVAVAAVVAHTVLAYIDVRYTFSRRLISPFEQHLHAVLYLAPILAIVLLALADADLAGEPDRSLRELSLPQILLLLGSAGVLGGVPVLEEFVRAWRRARQSSASVG
jgi:hypothetical protein